MTDMPAIVASYEALSANIQALLAQNHPANVVPSYTSGSASDSETGVHAAENEPGLGDDSADPVREAEHSPGLSTAPSAVPVPPVPAPIPAAVPAQTMNTIRNALAAAQAAQANTASLIDDAMRAANQAVAGALAASAPQGVGGWRD